MEAHKEMTAAHREDGHRLATEHFSRAQNVCQSRHITLRRRRGRRACCQHSRRRCCCSSTHAASVQVFGHCTSGGLATLDVR